MFYYNNQPCTPSFLIGFFKNEVVLSVDAYPFSAFSNLTFHLEDTRIVFSGYTVLPDSKETELGSSDQEVSPLTDKNAGVVLMPVFPYGYYFLWCGYFWVSWVSFLTKDEFSVRVTKITSRIGVSWTHSLRFCFWPIFNSIIMAILSKECKTDNFE